VCSAERRSVEPMKMKIIQAKTGSQNLMKDRTFIAQVKHCGSEGRLQSASACEL
jgi:hypothetical protein